MPDGPAQQLGGRTASQSRRSLRGLPPAHPRDGRPQGHRRRGPRHAARRRGPRHVRAVLLRRRGHRARYDSVDRYRLPYLGRCDGGQRRPRWRPDGARQLVHLLLVLRDQHGDARVRATEVGEGAGLGEYLLSVCAARAVAGGWWIEARSGLAFRHEFSRTAIPVLSNGMDVPTAWRAARAHFGNVSPVTSDRLTAISQAATESCRRNGACLTSSRSGRSEPVRMAARHAAPPNGETLNI